MTYDGEAHVSLLGYPEIRDRLIYLDGASKTYAMTGWRLGWSVWPKPLYDAARKLAVNSHSCVNAATQWAGIAALERPAGRVARDGGRVRPPPAARGRGPEQAARRLLHRRRRAPSTPSRTSRGPAGRPRRSPPRCSRRPASRRSAGRISASTARAISACPTPTRRRTSCGRWSGWASSWSGARRRDARPASIATGWLEVRSKLT